MVDTALTDFRLESSLLPSCFNGNNNQWLWGEAQQKAFVERKYLPMLQVLD